MEKLTKYTNTAHILKTNELVDKVNLIESEGGKIQKIKVNNKDLPISPSDKSVNIDLTGYSEKTHKHKYSEISGTPTSLPANGGNSSTVNGHTVESNVPANAKFTDTIYTHPANHPASMITGLANIAKTGNYNDLTNKPTALSAFTNDTNFITSSSNITGNAATATLADKATKDAKGNIIDSTYAKDKDIYLYVGKNPVVSELNENTIVIDPDEESNTINNIKRSEENAKESELKATAEANTATQQAVKATTEAEKAKAEAEKAKIAADKIGNPVVNITQSGGNLTVTKGDGSSNTLTVTPAKASQAEAEAGTDDTKMMTALRTKQAIEAFDNTPVGDVVFRPFLKAGYVKANGATVNRADYPRLVAFANANNLWTSSPSTEPWKFGQGNGSSTMVLPNYIGRFIQGGDMPQLIREGLPNITGMVNLSSAAFLWNVDGAFDYFEENDNTNPGGPSDDKHSTAFTFNASKSNAIYGASDTVQPPSITLIPQIRF